MVEGKQELFSTTTTTTMVMSTSSESVSLGPPFIHAGECGELFFRSKSTPFLERGLTKSVPWHTRTPTYYKGYPNLE